MTRTAAFVLLTASLLAVPRPGAGEPPPGEPPPEAPAAESQPSAEAPPPRPAISVADLRLFVLGFNSWGELLTPGDLDLTISTLEARPEIDRIVILSYGWANDGEASFATYLELLRALGGGQVRLQERTAVIAVGWDSSQTGFRKLFNNLIPLPGIANALAWLPDTLLFPISFWSKAAQADRIGFGGLREALNRVFEVYERRGQEPEVFLVGHSFGTRILSGLMLNNLGVIEAGGEPFRAARFVKAAVLLQPAAVPPNLHRDAPYPVIATMSKHDHANGLLFPLANLPLNSFGFTAFEALVRRQLETVGGTVESTVGAVGGVLNRSGETSPSEEGSSNEHGALLGIPRRGEYVVRRTLAEVVAIPAALVFTVVATPLNYVYIQGRGLLTRPIDHVMDTLATLPLVEVPVYGLDRALGRPVPWGQRSKGFLTIGPLQEPVGRMLVPMVTGPPIHPPRLALADDSTPCGLVQCEGVLVVDASDLIRRGSFGQDLSNPWWEFTIGWLDPIGAHGHWNTPEIGDILGQISRRVSERPASAE